MIRWRGRLLLRGIKFLGSSSPSFSSRGRAEINYFGGETYSACLIKPWRGWTGSGWDEREGSAEMKARGEYLVCDVGDDLCL